MQRMKDKPIFVKKIIMKFFFALLVASFFTTALYAQDCSNYYYLQNNKTIELTMKSRKGKDDGKVVYNIKDVKKSGGATTATLHSEIFDKKGKSLAKSVAAVKCKGGNLMMDIRMFIPSGQGQQVDPASAKFDDVYIEYPGNMKVGDALNDGRMSGDVKMQGGMEARMEMEITNRSVVAKESVTTPAGTWECFKITYNSKFTTRIAGIGIPIKMEITEWYAPGFGLVKSESKYGSMEVTSIR
jgi:hypothetical protein